MTPAPSGSAPDDPDGFKETRREALLSPCLLSCLRVSECPGSFDFARASGCCLPLSLPLSPCLLLHRAVILNRMIMRVLATLLTGMLLATAAKSTVPPNLLADSSGLNEGKFFATYVEDEPAGLPESGVSSPQPAAPRKVAIGKNVWFEIEGKTRRVIFNAYVCFRAGPLEQLLSRRGTKEHEAILAADVDARDIHRASCLPAQRTARLSATSPNSRRPPAARFVSPCATKTKARP